MLLAFLGLVLSVFQLGFGQDIQKSAALSLQDCVRIALEKSPELAVARHRLVQSNAQLRKAYAPFSPQASFQASRIQYGYDLAGKLNKGNRYDSHTYSTLLGSQWNIFNGFRDLDRLQSAQYDREANAENLSATREQLILNTVQAYFGMLLSGKAIEVQMENLKSKQEHLELAQARHKAGVRSYSDVLNAQIQVKQSEIQLLDAETRRTSTLYALNILMDRPILSTTTLQDAFQFDPVQEDLERAIHTAFGQRPEIRQAQAELQSSQKVLRLAYHDFLPALNVGGLYNYNPTALTSVAPGTVFSSPNPHWQVNLGLNFPFWDGGARFNEITRGRSAVDSGEANLERARRAVKREVADAHLNLEKNKKVYQVASDQVAAAREGLQIVTERYKNGSASVLDVVDAQANLLRIQLEAVGALYNFHIAKFALKRAMGEALFNE